MSTLMSLWSKDKTIQTIHRTGKARDIGKSPVKRGNILPSEPSLPSFRETYSRVPSPFWCGSLAEIENGGTFGLRVNDRDLLSFVLVPIRLPVPVHETFTLTPPVTLPKTPSDSTINTLTRYVGTFTVLWELF